MATITVRGSQLPEVINHAITKAGLSYGKVYPTAIVQAGAGEHIIGLSNGDVIKATLVHGGSYPRIVSIDREPI